MGEQLKVKMLTMQWHEQKGNQRWMNIAKRLKKVSKSQHIALPFYTVMRRFHRYPRFIYAKNRCFLSLK